MSLVSHLVCFVFIIVGCCLSQVKGQGRYYHHQPHHNSRLTALDKMENVTTLDEFMDLLTFKGRKLRHSDIFSEYESKSRQLVMAGGGRLAVPDACSPRNTTINIQVRNTAATSVYFPKCTKIERCGGCCASRHLECVPSYTERVSINVVKAEMPFPGSTYLVYTGFENIILERHLTCEVRCTLTEADCGENKEFLPHQCDCVCWKYERCGAHQVWNPSNCRCECAERHDCCCGLVFSPDTCQCEIDRAHASAGSEENITNPGSHDNIPQNRRPQQAHVQQPDNGVVKSGNIEYKVLSSHAETVTLGEGQIGAKAPPTRRKPAPNSPRTSSSSGPCAKIQCPPRFRKRVDDAGRCACQPSGRHRGFRSRRRDVIRRRYRSRY